VQFLSTWEALEPRKRVIVVVAALATFLAIVGLARMSSAPNMALLYAGLDPSSAGQIITQLEQNGTKYDVRGESIFVDSTRRDELRLSLAGQGLPKNSTQGYEILESLNGFGTTAQMFDAAYWHAREGELARTILASPNVTAARVHIANPVKQIFDRSQKTTASVTVSLSGDGLSRKQAQSIRFLVSSSVAGLAPDSVTVIDSVNGIVLAAGKEGSGLADSDDPTTKAALLKTSIERLLSARVGEGRALVEVMVDTNRVSETTVERSIDPQSRTAISAESSEKNQSRTGSGPGAVTVASNLPDGDAGAGGGQSSSTNAETREITNYDVSELRRERVTQPGEIKKISVAVMVDGIESPDAAWQPRPDEELQALKELVQSAIGFDQARGDVVTIQSLQLSPITTLGTPATSGLMYFLAANAMNLLQLLALTIVALVTTLMVLRPMLAQPPEPADSALGAGDEAVDGEIDPLDPAGGPAAMIELTPSTESQLEELRTTIAARGEESSQLLRKWIETPEPGEEEPA